MKLFKLAVTGSESDFSINYTSSNDFMNYKVCGFEGSEEEKYAKFIDDLYKNGGMQPVNIKVKMTTKAIDRALSKNEILKLRNVSDFVKTL